MAAEKVLAGSGFSAAHGGRGWALEEYEQLSLLGKSWVRVREEWRQEQTLQRAYPLM